MTKLMVEPLYTTLEQEFRFKLEGRCILAAIAPYIYMHNTPAGTFDFSVYKENDLIFSREFDSAYIKSSFNTTDGYAHVYLPMIPVNPVFFTKGTYRAVLSASGYTHKGNSFLGWVREFENVREEMDYTPISDSQNPLSMRRKVYKQGINS